MTAEAAMVLPVLVLVVTTLVWVLLVVLAQIQCVDAARAGARAAARQDPDGAVTRVTRDVAPHGAEVTVTRRGDRVHVVVVADPPGLGVLPFRLREEAVAEAEDTLGARAERGTGT
ncbi:MULTISPECIES: TadE family type IV pilus minor pilin [unclassified Streptomyces]|uniref:TadE family type IV pilus minor pilin n=1 Tax=Streptomyces sp. HYC2 TaxID=2955207 RepID=UPI001CD3BB14|nr:MULTISPECIES: TadE family type IV pilus minor pilin [unclassified Streptomyces]